MADAKSTEQILETIDQLRKRKARPDLDRICHMVERRYGRSPSQTQAEIERLVDAEVVIKVDYKGSTSYRNAAKWGKKNTLSGQILNSNDVSRSLIDAVRKCQENANGVSVRDVEGFLTSKNSHTKLVKSKLQVALEREVVACQLVKLSNGNFVVPTGKKEVENGGGANAPAVVDVVTAAPAVRTTTVPLVPKIPRGETSVVAAATVVAPLSKGVNKFDDMEKIMLLTKKGRPSNKRKRFKKTHGPDFVENYDSSFEEPEPKCDYCLLTAAYNYHGKPEELLFCKDCNAKAHPSCMDYSAELAVRSRMSPWQCMDCKTCFVCEDSEDADSMLFCDACDKGYHMGCHTPKINEKPSGKWVCYQCAGERKRKNGSVNNNIPRKHLVLEPMEAVEVETPAAPANNQTVDGGAPGLPTPCESPVPEGEQQKQMFNYFTLHNESLNENKENTEIPDASEWTIDDVENYFRQAGFPEQATAFKDQEIDGKSLLLLKRSDVLSGLSIKLGPALKIYNHVVQLQTRKMEGHLIG